jgi:hypothetical protein
LISKELDRLGDLETISLVLYWIVVLLVGLGTHAYANAISLVILGLVGFIMTIPGSLLIGAVLELLAQPYDMLFQS